LRGRPSKQRIPDSGRYFITSAVYSPQLERNIALAMVSLEWAGKGSELLARCSSGDHHAIVVDVPFIDPQKQRAKSPQQ
jgi:aminomethyltransferase